MTDKNNTPPKPEYGEMAPEGWVNPVTGETANAADAPNEATPAKSSPPAPAAPAAVPAAAPATTETPAATPKIEGVPHNLGVNTARSKSKVKAAQASSTASSDAPEATLGADGTNKPAPQRRRDRIFTIILLGFGAVNAYSMSDTLRNLQFVAADFYEQFGLGAYTEPEWIAVGSIVAAITILSIWTAALLVSIALIRKGRLSFYVPLAAGVIATIVFYAVFMSATPELNIYLQEFVDTNGFDIQKLQELQ